MSPARWSAARDSATSGSRYHPPGVLEPELATESSYDDVPYGASAHPSTHPDRLATVATLFGASPPAVAEARVLELGCARGGNLIPMAVAAPQAHFVGIDLSGRQIEDAQTVASKLGLSNIEFRHASILDVDASYGEFDYIICHGVFAWVPRDVQDKILSIYAEHLTPNGVGHVSYNTYPGWHFRGMVRDMLVYHSSGFSDPPTRIAAAKAMLGFLAHSAGHESPYGRILNAELELLAKLPDYYLFHEHLEPDNRPLYFHEFAERVAGANLQYLGDADPPTMGHFNFPDEVQQVLSKLSNNVVQAEQYMDFLRNRTFRQSLLVKPGVHHSRSLTSASLQGLRVSSSAEIEGSTDGPEFRFRGRTSETLTTRDRVLVTALRALRQHWPRSIVFEDLARAVSSTVGAGLDEVGRSLGVSFLRLYLSSRLIDLHAMPPAFVGAVSDRPVASPLARLQAVESTDVTNLRHEAVRLGDAERVLLAHLDGTRSRDDVLGLVKERATGEAILQQFASRALLVA
jgi:methyltransferase-like protein/2-polyprenyl-3-methyl-5-hydroxy-6-metoxy-1,4-benzoquinol methylase